MVCIGKGKRKVLTLDAKRAIVERLQKREKPSSLMKEFNWGEANILDIKKNKERILAFISTMETSSGVKRCKTLKKEPHEDVEKATSCRSVAEGLLSQDRSLLRRHCSSTAGFMARSLEMVSRLVKGS